MTHEKAKAIADYLLYKHSIGLSGNEWECLYQDILDCPCIKKITLENTVNNILEKNIYEYEGDICEKNTQDEYIEVIDCDKVDKNREEFMMIDSNLTTLLELVVVAYILNHSFDEKELYMLRMLAHEDKEYQYKQRIVDDSENYKIDFYSDVRKVMDAFKNEKCTSRDFREWLKKKTKEDLKENNTFLMLSKIIDNYMIIFNGNKDDIYSIVGNNLSYLYSNKDKIPLLA